MLKKVKKVFELEVATGLILMLVTIAALLIVNSKYFTIYNSFFDFNLPLNLDFFEIKQNFTVTDWINEALMSLFFLLIGLELKEEILVGELSSRKRAMLPVIAACGGIIFPALIFYFCNFNQVENLRGFAIPCATDIAFSYGIICLFGKKISKSLKVFLISLAIFDDLIAILIIAIFYSQNIDFKFLLFASSTLILLAILNYQKIEGIYFYLLLGIILWLMILKSGIHPTITGVALAIFIPRQNNILHNLIKKIAPTVNFFILPLFAFANSGVVLENFSSEIFTQPLFLGIFLGLFFGKQIGVMLFSFLSVKLNLAQLPINSQLSTSWQEFYSVVILTGVGFTMSFFIGFLAFENNTIMLETMKIAVLCGSFSSAIFAILMIFLLQKKQNFIK